MFEKLSPKEKQLVKEFLKLNGKHGSYKTIAEKLGNTENYIRTKFNHSIFIKYQVNSQKELLKKLLQESAKGILKVVLLFISVIVFSVSTAHAETSESTLNNAINIISNYGYTKNVEALQSYDTKIQYIPLYEVNYLYKTFYAITCESNTDTYKYILVDSRLKNCDVRVLACLLLHESVHVMSKSKVTDLKEEYKAHKIEQELYTKILKDNQDLQNKANDELVTRENKLLLLDDESIKNMLNNSSNYKLLTH